MTIDDQEERYEHLLQEAEVEISLESGNVGASQRKHPRFDIQNTEMQVDVPLQVSVVNISRSGVCFFSNQRFEIGQKFDFKVGSLFSIQAEVILCEMEETDSGLMEMHFQVRSKFSGQELDLHSLFFIIDK